MSENKKRKKYSIEFKKIAAQDAISSNNCAAARKFGVSECMIRKWRDSLPQILDEIANCSNHKTPSKKFRIDNGGGGSGRRVENVALEHATHQEFLEERNKGHGFTRKSISELARNSPLAKEGFKASPGWCASFMKRYQISNRASTHQGQKLPENHETKILNYFRYLRGLHLKKEYDPSQIIAMDQTAVYFDCVF